MRLEILDEADEMERDIQRPRTVRTRQAVYDEQDRKQAAKVGPADHSPGPAQRPVGPADQRDRRNFKGSGNVKNGQVGKQSDKFGNKSDRNAEVAYSPRHDDKTAKELEEARNRIMQLETQMANIMSSQWTGSLNSQLTHIITAHLDTPLGVIRNTQHQKVKCKHKHKHHHLATNQRQI